MTEKIAWAITGAGHNLGESVRIFIETKKILDFNLTVFLSNAGKEVSMMYGKYDELINTFQDDKSFEIFDETSIGASSYKTGAMQLGGYKALFVCPATANTVAKIVNGIADTPPTNAVAMALKGNVPVYILPTDQDKIVETELPVVIDYKKCQKCQDCAPFNTCPKKAIKKHMGDIYLDHLSCNACGKCIEACKYGAITKGEKRPVHVRDTDIKNTKKLAKLPGVTVLKSPVEVVDIIKGLVK